MVVNFFVCLFVCLLVCLDNYPGLARFPVSVNVSVVIPRLCCSLVGLWSTSAGKSRSADIGWSWHSVGGREKPPAPRVSDNQLRWKKMGAFYWDNPPPPPNPLPLVNWPIPFASKFQLFWWKMKNITRFSPPPPSPPPPKKDLKLPRTSRGSLVCMFSQLSLL